MLGVTGCLNSSAKLVQEEKEIADIMITLEQGIIEQALNDAMKQFTDSFLFKIGEDSVASLNEELYFVKLLIVAVLLKENARTRFTERLSEYFSLEMDNLLYLFLKKEINREYSS